MSATIYFLRCGDSDLVKVGWTSAPVSVRIDSLQVGCPHDLRLLAARECRDASEARRGERALHAVLSRYRVRGEWYRLAPNTIAELPALCAETRLVPFA